MSVRSDIIVDHLSLREDSRGGLGRVPGAGFTGQEFARAQDAQAAGDAEQMDRTSSVLLGLM
jgi:hypothetical protein